MEEVQQEQPFCSLVIEPVRLKISIAQLVRASDC